LLELLRCETATAGPSQRMRWPHREAQVRPGAAGAQCTPRFGATATGESGLNNCAVREVIT
jgi:hypothetical protein